MEGHSGFCARGGDLRDGLHGADLVVGPHHGAQRNIGAEALAHEGRIDTAQRVDAQPIDLASLLPQPDNGVQDSVVLDGRAEDARALRMRPGQALDREVVCLGAPRGEDHLTGTHVQVVGNGLSCFLDQPARRATSRMQ